MGWVWVLVPITMFVSMGLGHALRGPLGQAIADRIGARGGSEAGDAAVRAEVEALRERVAELEERADFTERVLARDRAHRPLAGGD